MFICEVNSSVHQLGRKLEGLSKVMQEEEKQRFFFFFLVHGDPEEWMKNQKEADFRSMQVACILLATRER